MNNKDMYLINKGISISFIMGFIDHQTNVLTRENADRESIVTSIKTVFNEMMNNGDVEFSDWSLVKERLDNLKFQRVDTLKEDLQQEHLINLITDICINCPDEKGTKYIDCVTLENFDKRTSKNDISDDMASLMVLLNYRQQLDNSIKDKIKHLDASIFKKETTKLIDTYGSLLTESYIKNLKTMLG